jgi:Ca-activated chloride channel family protein
MLRIKSDATTRDQKYVALKSVSVDSKIRSFGADVSITQLFRNDENQPIEAVYCFPIEENAAIYSFTAKIDDREIRAQLKEKVQAQQEYTQALQQGHGAYLMEQDEKSQDIFIINVGALLPGKECQIQIIYVTELILINENKIHFVVPTTIAPRYNPLVGGISSPAGTKAKYVQSAPYTIDFRCQIDKLNEQITGVSSSSHPIKIQFNKNIYEITFGQKNTFMDRDIIVDIELSTRTNTILAVEKNGEHQLALMASFTPTNEDCRKVLDTSKKTDDVNNEFIFIVDCSGSMQDENKIGLARQAMILFLKSLPVNCQFNIIRFGSNYATLFNRVTEEYNEQNAKQAEQLILQMSADLGGTELLRPLQWLKTQPPAANHSRQILLLTDGEISNVTEVMDLCRSMSTSSRIFSFGLGHSPSRSLIKGLARSTNGRFTFIPPGTSVDIYVAEQLQKALEPCITNVKVKWNIPSLVSSKLQTVPTIVPPVYANDRLLFYALIDSDQFDHLTTVELWNHDETVRLGSARIDHVPETIIGNSNQLITHLAAKALIQEITHAKELYTGSQQTRFQQVKEDDNKKRITDISLKYNILCPHTAFIGIETRTDSSAKNANSNMVLREIPIEISADDKAMIMLSFGSGLFGSSSTSPFNTNAKFILQQRQQHASGLYHHSAASQGYSFGASSNYYQPNQQCFSFAPPPPPVFNFVTSSSQCQQQSHAQSNFSPV